MVDEILIYKVQIHRFLVSPNTTPIYSELLKRMYGKIPWPILVEVWAKLNNKHYEELQCRK